MSNNAAENLGNAFGMANVEQIMNIIR